MPTTNPRINVTLDPDLNDTLTTLANKEGKSVAGLCRDLIVEALDRREDQILSAMAEGREITMKRAVGHDTAW